MSEFTMDRLRENLEALKMKNTLEILDNYLERAVAENLNIVDVLDHIFAEEAKSKRKRAYEKQIQMSGFPIKKTLDDFDFSFQPSIDKRQIDELATMRFMENGENVVFLGPPGVGKTHLASALGLVAAQHRFSTYYVNCHQLIEQLKKAHFENRLPDKLRVLSKYKMLIIDEIGYLPMDIQGANLFFQLIARRYEKTSTVFTSNKTFSQPPTAYAIRRNLQRHGQRRAQGSAPWALFRRVSGLWPRVPEQRASAHQTNAPCRPTSVPPGQGRAASPWPCGPALTGGGPPVVPPGSGGKEWRTC